MKLFIVYIAAEISKQIANCRVFISIILKVKFSFLTLFVKFAVFTTNSKNDN